MSYAQKDLLPVLITSKKLYKPNQALAIQRGTNYQADYVSHFNLETIKLILSVLGKERDKLLVKVLFDGCFRCSEAISIRPADIIQDDTGWSIRILGKGNKRSVVAISASLAAQIQSYAYRNNILPEQRIFPITRGRVHQIIKKALSQCAVVKPDGVGSVHILRHSGAIERLKQTGNPKAVQEQLRHKSAQMTLRYMKTLSHIEAIEIQKGVDFQW